MKGVNLKRDFRDLEMRVFSEIRSLIAESDVISKHIQTNCIKLNDYEEIVIVDDKLTILNYSGQHYAMLNIPLEILIDVIVFSILNNSFIFNKL